VSFCLSVESSVLLFVRGFGDLLLLSSVALAPSLVRSLVQL